MIETLIFLTCIKGSADACENSSVAYYKQSGIEHMITAKESHLAGSYPGAAAGIAVVGALAQGRATFNMGEGKTLTVDASRSMLGFKTGF